jgi:PTH1 family peptidyl-tRNA hydrolase
MKLLVGLGNPGEKYAQTRHNLGYMVLDRLAEKNEEANEKWKQEAKFHAEILHFTYNQQSYTLLKPQTFMNNSGQAVQAFASYYKIEPKDIAVVYDELDIPIGSLRVRNEGSAGGHNGVKSIIEHLGTDKFMRIRLGIGTDDRFLPAEEFVLAPFHPSERKEIEKMVEKAVEDIQLIMENGIEKYLSTHHGK